MSTPFKPQRLALFLDGTWNNEDDSTNVLHAYHLTLEGEMPDGYIQKRYYDRGVGTGMLLDSFIGGGLGYGLEKNVREAYNWLVSEYNDGDEVYIFGFSRGAYTARSLVGLIAACGLVRRGAPLTVNQLWGAYGFISQNRGRLKNKEAWKEALEKHPDYFRRINDIARDEWSKHGKGFKGDPINESERLLREWSRRIQITYLGVFDTVGALGINALGIPGLNSRLANSHNQRPTSILKSCRHALAVNENRTSFRLTPILNYISHWPRKNFKDYKGIISQRWFIGAHSNIGGGYTNNTYANRPFDWILEGAKAAHLHLCSLTTVSNEAKCPLDNKPINDSYSNFAGVLWPHILREKRLHRPIGRAADVRAGFSLVTVHEEVDESVFELFEKDETYRPPNLLSYIQRSSDEDKPPLIVDRSTLQKWPGDRLVDTWKDWLLARGYLILWAILAALGLFSMLQFLWVDPLPIGPIEMALLAAFYVLVDWTEARTTLEASLHPEAVIPRVIWNISIWMRLLGVLAFVVGLLIPIGAIIPLAMDANISWAGIQLFLVGLWNIFTTHLLYPLLGASGMILLLDTLGAALSFKATEDKAQSYLSGIFDFHKREGERKDSSFAFIATVVIALVVVVAAAYFCWPGDVKMSGVEVTEALAGKFLFLQILIAAFVFISGWLAKPMGKSRANLGGQSQLQQIYSPSQLTELLNYWGSKMLRGWGGEDIKKRTALAWVHTRKMVRIALWRDLLGFIPIYSFVFLLAFYLAAECNWWNCSYLSNTSAEQALIPWWGYFVGAIALLDIIENSIHLRHLKKHPEGGSSSALFYTGFLVTWLKLIGFFIAAIVTIVVSISLAYEMLQLDSGGWRWAISVALIYLGIIAVVYFLFSEIKKIPLLLSAKKKKS